MIRPLRACHPECPGWRRIEVRTLAGHRAHVVRPCRACWCGEVLKPTAAYYRRALKGNKFAMKIVEVGNEYFRRGQENAKTVYVVRVGDQSYDVVASSEDGAKNAAEERYEREVNCIPGRGPRAESCAIKTAPMTTLETLKASQVRALRAEAALAGDTAQVEICDRAMNGDREALRECVRVINDAEAGS